MVEFPENEEENDLIKTVGRFIDDVMYSAGKKNLSRSFIMRSLMVLITNLAAETGVPKLVLKRVFGEVVDDAQDLMTTILKAYRDTEDF